MKSFFPHLFSVTSVFRLYFLLYPQCSFQALILSNQILAVLSQALLDTSSLLMFTFSLCWHWKALSTITISYLISLLYIFQTLPLLFFPRPSWLSESLPSIMFPFYFLKSPISYLTNPALWGTLFHFKFHNHLVLQKALCTEWECLQKFFVKSSSKAGGVDAQLKWFFFFLPPLLQIPKDSHIIFLDLSSANKINACPIYLNGYYINVLFLPIPPSRLILL